MSMVPEFFRLGDGTILCTDSWDTFMGFLKNVINVYAEPFVLSYFRAGAY